MRRRTAFRLAALVISTMTAGVTFAQQRGQAPEGQAPAAGRGRGAAAAADAATRPPMLFREEWKYAGQSTDEARRVNQSVVSNTRLELKLYGDAKNVEVYQHEGRNDLWSGMTTAPVALTLRDKANYMDLTGLARLRWMVRTSAIHALYPTLKLADGTLIVGARP